MLTAVFFWFRRIVRNRVDQPLDVSGDPLSGQIPDVRRECDRITDRHQAVIVAGRDRDSSVRFLCERCLRNKHQNGEEE